MENKNINEREIKKKNNSRKRKKRKRKKKSSALGIIGKLLSILLAIVIIVVLITFGVTVYATNKINIQYTDLIYKYSEENDLDPFFTASVISVESSFIPTAESHAGAVGLMQLMPDTAAWISEKKGIEYYESNLTDPETNIELGTAYFRYLLDYYNGSEHLALAAYNGGMGNVDNWLDSGEITTERDAIENIPYKEPREYVSKVERRKELIELFYGDEGLENIEKTTIGLVFDNYLDLIKRLIKEF